ncbi:Mpv17 / PMP22 family protein [Nitzschia inconspicua]|uniref:Mpv17 / PMP22 family protein n=1 Tax=Nitzschia inconspicua TaxID=303405 RepID=A0A9K3M1J9_9STRA|nr:Mpv17 / PMP22 family protein [Nitzschia inconspicua]
MMHRAVSQSCILLHHSYQVATRRITTSLGSGKPPKCGGSGLILARRWFGVGSTSNVTARRTFFAWYSKKLDTHPVTTKCISAGLISSVGNILAQKITHLQKEEENELGRELEPFQLELAQVSRFSLLNMAFVAPVLHHWYQFINRALPGTSLSRVVQRTFWDEFVFSPVYIPIFLGMLWKLEGNSNENIWKMTKSEVPSIIMAEWVTWVPTMLVTFRYVPVKFQVLVINVVGVVWQTFLAYMANNAHKGNAFDDAMN